MCGQHNVRASAEYNAGQNTDKGHTPNPRREIKISDPAGNRTRAAAPGWKAGSTKHATATDYSDIYKSKIQCHVYSICPYINIIYF